MKVPAVAAVLLLASVAGVPVGGATQEQQPRPTFKSSVDLVPVDVNIVDKDGRPIAEFTGYSRTVGGAVVEI